MSMSCLIQLSDFGPAIIHWIEGGNWISVNATLDFDVGPKYNKLFLEGDHRDIADIGLVWIVRN